MSWHKKESIPEVTFIYHLGQATPLGASRDRMILLTIEGRLNLISESKQRVEVGKPDIGIVDYTTDINYPSSNFTCNRLE